LFLACIFKHYDRSDLIFFGRFKNVLVYDRKMTEKMQMRLTVNLIFKVPGRKYETLIFVADEIQTLVGHRYRCII